mmetsp:Transcript_25151/g.28984  ORF Transcript_25151/g.28984 Transcript_25151/m.28984 type:complete len:308 (-) Transcript_25151:388-1311(-)
MSAPLTLDFRDTQIGVTKPNISTKIAEKVMESDQIDMCASFTIAFRDTQISVTHPNVSTEIAQKAMESDPFKRWIKNCEKVIDRKTIILRGVEIQTVDMFGPHKVGFIKVKADAYLVFNGIEVPKAIPGIAFLRGNAVGILVALNCEDGEKYTLLVEQPRIPVGDVTCLELPAGMIDANDDVKGQAVSEMEEECMIKLKKSDLIALTETTMLPSAGGCDEGIDLYYVERKVTVREMEDMQGRLTGNKEQGEHIKLHVVPFNTAWKLSGDAKLLCSMFLYDKVKLSEKSTGGKKGKRIWGRWARHDTL